MVWWRQRRNPAARHWPVGRAAGFRRSVSSKASIRRSGQPAQARTMGRRVRLSARGTSGVRDGRRWPAAAAGQQHPPGQDPGVPRLRYQQRHRRPWFRPSSGHESQGLRPGRRVDHQRSAHHHAQGHRRVPDRRLRRCVYADLDKNSSRTNAGADAGELRRLPLSGRVAASPSRGAVRFQVAAARAAQAGCAGDYWRNRPLQPTWRATVGVSFTKAFKILTITLR